jgi:hypothetical protein
MRIMHCKATVAGDSLKLFLQCVTKKISLIQFPVVVYLVALYITALAHSCDVFFCMLKYYLTSYMYACSGFVCEGNFKDSPVRFGMNVLNCQEPPGMTLAIISRIPEPDFVNVCEAHGSIPPARLGIGSWAP